MVVASHRFGWQVCKTKLFTFYSFNRRICLATYQNFVAQLTGSDDSHALSLSSTCHMLQSPLG